MRARWLGGWIAAAALVAVGAEKVEAQWYYPGGYGSYGWGGWNSIGNVYGSYARGLGWYAVGQGVYNLDTAQARSINVNTNMRLNEYLYESLLQHDRRLWAAKQKDIQASKDAVLTTQDRLRNNPTPQDIQTGDALNVALTELTDPRYSYQVGDIAAKIPISADLVKQIPLRNAVEAITISLDELTSGEVPPVFQKPEFAEGVKKYRALIEELDKQALEKGQVETETVKQLRVLLNDSLAKLNADDSLTQEEKQLAARNLRTLLGLSYMLDGPALDVYMAGIEEVKDLTLAKLLSFMQSFNLRFGVAHNPNEVQVNQQVFALLSKARAEAFGSGTGTLPGNAPTLSDRTTRPTEFYGHLDEKDLDAEKNRSGLKAPN